MSVAEKLDELEQLSTEFLASIRKEPRQAGDRVMSMREEFNDLCLAIVQEMTRDPRIASNREIFEAMQNALEAVRSGTPPALKRTPQAISWRHSRCTT